MSISSWNNNLLIISPVSPLKKVIKRVFLFWILSIAISPIMPHIRWYSMSGVEFFIFCTVIVILSILCPKALVQVVFDGENKVIKLFYIGCFHRKRVKEIRYKDLRWDIKKEGIFFKTRCIVLYSGDKEVEKIYLNKEGWEEEIFNKLVKTLEGLKE